MLNTAEKSLIRKVDAACALVLVAVVLVCAYVLIGTSIRKTNRLKAEQSELTAQLDYLTELGETLGDSEETLIELQQGMEMLDQRLPVNLDFESFYGYLSARAQACNVEIEEVLPSERADEGNYVKLDVNIRAESSFDGIHVFLFDVMSAPRLTKLEHMRIRRDTTTDVCNVDMALAIYARSEPVTE